MNKSFFSAPRAIMSNLTTSCWEKFLPTKDPVLDLNLSLTSSNLYFPTWITSRLQSAGCHSSIQVVQMYRKWDFSNLFGIWILFMFTQTVFYTPKRNFGFKMCLTPLRLLEAFKKFPAFKKFLRENCLVVISLTIKRWIH